MLIRWPFQQSSALAQQDPCYASYPPSLIVVEKCSQAEHQGNSGVITGWSWASSYDHAFLKDQSSVPMWCLKILVAFILSGFMFVFSRRINLISIILTRAEVVSFSYPHSWNTSSPTCPNITIPCSFFFYVYWLILVSFNGPSMVYLLCIITTPGLTTGMFSVLSIYAILECLN